MTANPEKLLNALRAIGQTNAMIDEDVAHWLIMTTPEQVDSPIKLRKQFVRLAQPQSIEFLLHEKLNNPVWQKATVQRAIPECLNCFDTGRDADLIYCPFCLARAGAISDGCICAYHTEETSSGECATASAAVGASVQST